jgi:hypothetical protein
MEMKRINAGKLRAIGYDMRERMLRVELNDGTAIEYAGVGQEVWRRFSTVSSSTAWSFYRDNIEEEFHGKRGRITTTAKAATSASTSSSTNIGRMALEDLFKSTDSTGEA